MNKDFHYIRVLHIITSLNKGGAEMMLFKLLSRDTDCGSRSMVLSLTGDGFFGCKIRSLNIPVISLELKNPVMSFFKFKRIFRQLRLFKPDIIHSWMYHSNLFAVLLRSLIAKNIPLIWNIRHSLHGWKSKKWPIRFIIMLNGIFSSRPSQIVYNSNTSRSQHKKLGYRFDRATTIPNGFEENIYKPNLDIRNAARRKFAIPDNEILIGHVGRYHPIKGQTAFIESLSFLAKMTPPVSWRAIMIGKEITNDNLDLFTIIKKNGLEGKIILHGESDELQNIYPAMDIFCLSSISEAFPNVLGEAMLCQIPCISTNVGDSSDIIGDTGTVLSSSDPYSMAKALHGMCIKNHADREALGISARIRIIRNYSIKSIHDQYDILFKKVLTI